MKVTIQNRGLNRRVMLATPSAQLILAARATKVLVSPGGRAGPPGPAGSTDPLVVTRIADTVLSGHRAVRPVPGGRAGYISAADPAQSLSFLGITTGAALQDANISIITLGTMIEPSWTWTPGLPIYFGVDGVLTQTNDNAWAFIQIIAVAVTATEIFLNPKNPISL